MAMPIVANDGVGLLTPTKRWDVNGVSVNTIATLCTPTTGKRARLMGGSFSVNAAVSVLLEDNAAGAGNFIWRTPLLISGAPYSFDLGNGVRLAAVNNVLKGTGSGNATVTGTFYGVEEDA